MITDVYVWQSAGRDDMVMTFDDRGQQMPDYQGKIEECREKILADAPPTARFHSGQWRRGYHSITRDQFADLTNAPTPQRPNAPTPQRPNALTP